ncbi:hypothetical protein FACS18949_12490 [Clostridia bacterium]|nr:hypothetical protein FACS189425_09630 [Clostridia bacterium]GHV35135.1 hypothetical protein FACS18949_12490 [Clostridia bacterium]
MRDLLNNLVGNAIKYNVPDGSVTVGVQSQKRGAVITVADTGIGIAPAAQSRIFERFYRISGGKPVAGTGLGLAIVKHIVSGLGGEIELESTVGRGTRGTVVLPERRAARNRYRNWYRDWQKAVAIESVVCYNIACARVARFDSCR